MQPEARQGEQRAGIEDMLLAVLGLVAGPLLWWMGKSWESQPAASSMQTLEYWIALVCGFIGIALATIWLVFMVAGMAFVIGTKTRSAVLTSWAALFTPKFLRRILVSIVGTHLAFTSPAFASTESEPTPVETLSPSEQGAFMPQVQTPPIQVSTDGADQLQQQSTTPIPEPKTPESSGASSAPPADKVTPSPKPRETSKITVTPSTSPLANETSQPVPAPRQTSTIPMKPETLPNQTAVPHPVVPQPTDSAVEPSAPAPVVPEPSRPTEHKEPETLTVKSGDCLWDIAHSELGADATLFQIDHRWRQWWEYNANVIGDDPHTIQPGTVLEIPPFRD